MSPHQNEHYAFRMTSEVKLVGATLGVTCPPFVLPHLRAFFLQNIFTAGGMAFFCGLSIGTAINLLHLANNRKDRMLASIDLLFPCIVGFIVWSLISGLLMK